MHITDQRSPKIIDTHLQRIAYVYPRQSSMGQVRNHHESTERQYALQELARNFGWPVARINAYSKCSATSRFSWGSMRRNSSLSAAKRSMLSGRCVCTVPSTNPNQLSAATNKSIRTIVWWKGGVCEELRVELPRAAADRWRHDDALIERIRELAETLDDVGISAMLNDEGLRTNKGNCFTIKSIKWIRHKHNIARADDRKTGELTVTEAAERLKVRPRVIYYWISKGLIPGRRQNAGFTLRVVDGSGLRCHMPARPTLTPHLRFLFVSSRVCYTLLSDEASRPRPCASLILHLRQAG